jgi:hypothetical protein
MLMGPMHFEMESESNRPRQEWAGVIHMRSHSRTRLFLPSEA